MPKKKFDLKAAAEANVSEAAESTVITDAELLDICPPALLKRLTTAKTKAARADLLFAVYNKELKEARRAFTAIEDFTKKLKAWFLQELQGDLQGVTGKMGRVEVKTFAEPQVEDWDKFYAHIKKKGEFDLLSRALGKKAIEERWEHGKEVPGIGHYEGKKISLTKV